MAGEKIKQARNALLFCLNNLHPQDRFDVITFNESPDTLTRHLEAASEANIAKARRFVEDIEASGGTNIDEALRAALNLLRDEDGSQKMVVFLTDGLPTVGQTDINMILQDVKDMNGGRHLANLPPTGATEQHAVRDVIFRRGEVRRAPGANARIFCFGLGYDVNVPFLDRLAEVGRGDSDYVKPQEDIEVKVSAFFAKVTSPILANLKLAFDGADVYDIYPKELPDLFKGSQLVITGRFRGDGGGTVRLAGLANGDQESFSLGTKFADDSAGNSFLPRIWAARKIGYLIDQVRLSDNPGGRQEIIDEIVRLSREHGIITEYTSFLVDEREQRVLGLRLLPDGIRDVYGYETENSIIVRKEIAKRAKQNGVSGSEATDQSLSAKDYQKADKSASRYQTPRGGVYSLNGAPGERGPVNAAPGNFAAGRMGGLGGGGLGGSVGKSLAYGDDTNAITIQAVNDRAFYRQKNNVWQDHSYDAKKQKLVKIQAFSDAHFALIRAVPDLAAYSSVGDEVIVRLGKNAVQIGKEGKEKLTGAELRDITAK